MDVLGVVVEQEREVESRGFRVKTELFNLVERIYARRVLLVAVKSCVSLLANLLFGLFIVVGVSLSTDQLLEL